MADAVRRNRQPMILFVGSNANDRTRISSALRDGDRVCVESAAGVEAEFRLKRDRFDVVVSDVSEPEVDGVRLLGSIAKLSERPKVVVLTDKANPVWMRTAFRRGVFDVIPKPLDIRELTAVIDEALADRLLEDDATPSEGKVITVVESDTVSPLPTRPAFVEALRGVREVCRDEHATACLLAITYRRGPSTGCTSSRPPDAHDVHRIAKCLGRLAGQRGAFVRYAPDCFLVLMFGCDETEGMRAASRLQRPSLPPNSSDDAPLTCVTGLAATEPGFIISEDDLLQRALTSMTEALTAGDGAPICWSAVRTPTPSRRSLSGAAVDEVCGWINQARQQLKRGYLESTLALVAAVEAKEPFARRHAYMVSNYCEQIARQMSLAEAQIDTIKTAALLHDIGKIGVPDAILRKPGPLSASEFEEIKKHPATALDILAATSCFRQELPIILHHHEHFDGSGYPAGFGERDIPLGARILTVADTLDAMYSSRVYDGGRSIERIKAELNRCSGKQFDPAPVQAVLALLESRPDMLMRQSGSS